MGENILNELWCVKLLSTAVHAELPLQIEITPQYRTVALWFHAFQQKTLSKEIILCGDILEITKGFEPLVKDSRFVLDTYQKMENFLREKFDIKLSSKARYKNFFTFTFELRLVWFREFLCAATKELIDNEDVQAFAEYYRDFSLEDLFLTLLIEAARISDSNIGSQAQKNPFFSVLRTAGVYPHPRCYAFSAENEQTDNRLPARFVDKRYPRLPSFVDLTK